jgi:hypothetical protein
VSANLPSPYLEIVPTGAGEVRRLPDNGLGYIGAAWLPDGQRIVVSARESGRRATLYLLDGEKARPKAITPEGISSWAVSPDGATAAAKIAGAPIKLYSLDGPGMQEVPGMDGSEVAMGWIRDGLLVMRPADPTVPLGEVFRVDVRTGRRDSWKNILPDDPAGIMALVSFHVTPDGQSQAYSWHRALSSLYIADGLP